MPIDVKQAVVTAKDAVQKLFHDEDLRNIGLEEVVYDELNHCWRVTVGFSRPWDEPMVAGLGFAFAKEPLSVKRTYKVVKLNDQDGSLMAVENRC
ncbi:hypothetical protein WAE61_06365 [Comamonadaceae bacterium PP-2]